MRTRFEEAKLRAAQRREDARLDALERREARGDGATVRVLDIMGADDVEPGLERGDGFFIAHEVVATEPWHESLVRLGERPRVRHPLKVNGDPAEELRAARAALRGRKGKSRQLLKRRIERLEALVELVS
jgi:hypothetical protein